MNENDSTIQTIATPTNNGTDRHESDETATLLGLLGGPADGQVSIERIGTNGDIDAADIGLFLGYCGDFDDLPATRGMIQARVGGGTFKATGRANGKPVVKTFVLPGDSLPIVAKAQDDFEDFDAAELARADAEAKWWLWSPVEGWTWARHGVEPTVPPPNNGLPPAHLMGARPSPWFGPQTLGQVAPGLVSKELEEAREKARKLEEEARLKEIQAKHDRDIQELRALVQKTQQPTVDPMKGFMEMMAAQAAQQQQRYEQELKERADREEREAKERRDRDEKERQRREDDERRREQERREAADRQEKWLAQMAQSNDPTKLVQTMTAFKEAVGGGDQPDFAKQMKGMMTLVSSFDDLRGGGGKQTEAAEKLAAAERLVETVSRAAGGAIKEVAPAIREVIDTVRQNREVAKQQAQQPRGRQQQRRIGGYTVVPPRQIAQAPQAPQPAAPEAPQQQQPEGYTVVPPAAPAPVAPAAPAQPEAQGHQQHYVPILDFVLRAHAKGNAPEPTVAALLGFCEGIQAIPALREIVATDLGLIRTQLEIVARMPEVQANPEVSAKVANFIALTHSDEGKKWIQAVFAMLRQ